MSCGILIRVTRSVSTTVSAKSPPSSARGFGSTVPQVVQGIALIEFDDRGRDRIYAQGEELLPLVQPRTFVKG